MSRKSINISNNVRNKLRMCKLDDTERFAQTIERLLDKYENELMSDE